MKRIITLLLIATVVSAGLSARGSQESPQQAVGNFQDGNYRATFSHVDSHGWQPFLDIEVRDGSIRAARFDYVNAAGVLKSRDTAYNERMAAQTGGVSIVSAAPEMTVSLVQRQATPIDAISGATSSVQNFNTLAAALLQRAEAGNTERVVLPMNATYTAEDEPDQRGGWIAQFSAEYQDGRLVRVRYDEVLKVGGRVTDRKTTNSEYATRYREVNGITPAEVYQQLEQELLSAGDPGMVDTVTGATVASTRFRRVAAEALGRRVSANLP